MRSAQDDADLTALISTIKSETDGDSVSLGDLKDALGSRAFGPLVVIVALIAVLPTGAIPGMSLITGSVMLILSAQLLIGSATIWLPRQLSERAISRDRLVGSLDAAETYAKRVDRWIKPRLTFLFNPPFIQIVAALGMAVSLSMFPLALVPFGALPAGLSLLFIGLALAVRDGVLMAVGVALGLGGMALAGWLFLF